MDLQEKSRHSEGKNTGGQQGAVGSQEQAADKIPKHWVLRLCTVPLPLSYTATPQGKACCASSWAALSLYEEHTVPRHIAVLSGEGSRAPGWAAAGQESPATHCMSASEGRVKVVALWLIAPDIWVLLSHALFIFYFLPLINCEPHHGCQTGICRTEACGKAVIYGSLETKWHF